MLGMGALALENDHFKNLAQTRRGEHVSLRKLRFNIFPNKKFDFSIFLLKRDGDTTCRRHLAPATRHENTKVLGALSVSTLCE